MPPRLMEEGPFKGWMRWRDMDQGRFSDTIGPVYFRAREDGTVEAAAETGRQHSNLQDMLHGGYIMAFIDQVLFAVAGPRLTKPRVVPLTCTPEFPVCGWRGEVLHTPGPVTR